MVNFTRLLPDCDLCLWASGERQSSVSGSTLPCLHHARGPPGLLLTPEHCNPPWDETRPRAPSPHPGASVEPLALTHLTGRRFSLKSNPGERIQTWMDRQIDGWKDSDADTWRPEERACRGQVGGGGDIYRDRRMNRVSLDNGTFLNSIKLPGSSLRIPVAAFGPSNLSRFCEKGTCGRRDWPIQQLLSQQTHKHTPEGSSAATRTPSRVLLCSVRIHRDNNV